MNFKTIWVPLILLGTLNLNGQTLKEAENALRDVNKIEQFDKFKKQHQDWDISIDKTMTSDSLLFPNITNAKIGDIVLKQYNSNAPKYVMKVLKIENEELCKIKYIYISGAEYSKSEIDSLRTLIIERFKNGENFEALVKEYTMDFNPTGDLGWFYKGMMVDQFDKAVRNRSKGEIFTVDVEDKYWYYVILKTHDNKMEKAIKSIMIKYGI